MNGLRPLLDHPRRRPVAVVRRIGRRSTQPHAPHRPQPRQTPAAPAVQNRSLTLGAVMFVQYALLALDVQFIATKHYVGIVIVNAMIALNAWYLTRSVVQARTTWDRTWYITGGAAGAVLATWIT
jgi:hypothetical protein